MPACRCRESPSTLAGGKRGFLTVGLRPMVAFGGPPIGRRVIAIGHVNFARPRRTTRGTAAFDGRTSFDARFDQLFRIRREVSVGIGLRGNRPDGAEIAAASV